MVRNHVALWVAALAVVSLVRGATTNCASSCTDATFRGYTSCLRNCGTNVAVTNCDCTAMTCARCPGDSRCCQSCCDLKQCDCSAVSCQQPCSAPCCSMCCQPPKQQCDCTAVGCQQQAAGCYSSCCQPETSTKPSPQPQPSPPGQPSPPVVNISFPPMPRPPPAVVNVSMGNITVMPANITVLPANISFTPHITVVVNTSPISQVYPYQYAGNVSLSIQQPQAPPVNCTGAQRRCCRVVLAPQYPCPTGMPCPPMERIACGDRCNSIVSQRLYYPPTPRPEGYQVPWYYPSYYYPTQYSYVPQSSQYFCSSGCMPIPTWPFARCFDFAGAMPYGGTPAIYGTQNPFLGTQGNNGPGWPTQPEITER